MHSSRSCGLQLFTIGIIFIVLSFLQVKPGDRFNLTFINTLGPEVGPMLMNSLHWPNTSNIHTHGLHIDPTVDTVLLKVHPGESHTYHYVIPDNHSSGLLWYHTHSHGSSAFGVMGGQHGALIVDPLPSNPENLPTSYLAATKTLMVLSHVQFLQLTAPDGNGVQQISQGCSNGGGCSVAQGCSAGTTGSPFAPFRSYSYIELGNEMQNQMDPNPNYYGATTAPDVYLVNGLMTPQISMTVGEYRVIQLVHAGGAYFVEVVPGTICSWSILAIDGIYLQEVRTPQQKFLLQQAGRYELLVTCTAAGTQTFEIRAGAPPHSQDLFTIAVTNGAAGSKTPITTAEMKAIIRPDYLQDLYNLPAAAVQSTFELEFSQGGRHLDVCGFWLGSGDNCTAVWKGKDPSDVIAGNTCPFEQFVSDANTPNASRARKVRRKESMKMCR
jgi:FtsP/CotA-like multicopper oxidase with cupredoxin domain